MYSDKENVLQTVALLCAHGIREAVICPGSRNTPLAVSLVECSDVETYAVTDERSAGFFALGRALESRCAVAVCCTSGTALLNLHPAVAEAFYQQVPLVVLSADRPGAWIGQKDGQTVPQPDVFGGLVRRSVSLPEIRSDEDRWYCNRLLNEALLETDHHVKGPVHINIPLSEPLFGFGEERLPEVRTIRRHNALNERLSADMTASKRPMIVLGQQFEGDLLLPEGVVCLSEHTGNHPQGTIRNFDALLYTLGEKERTAFAPDLLITLGGHIVSKRLKEFLRKHPPLRHWDLDPTGRIEDLFRTLTDVVEVDDPRTILSQLSLKGDPAFYARWEERSRAISAPCFPYSEMAAVGALMGQLPQGAVLHLANSSVVRYAQLFEVDSSVEVHCNRGTSGIEGSLSTAVGYAAASHRPNFMVIGDLSFFYDMNGLWNGHLNPNLRLMLLNNGGGEIFHILPGIGMTPLKDRYVAASHTTRAEGWARECGFEYVAVTCDEELKDAVRRLTSEEKFPRPLFVEVFTRKEEDARLLKMYYHQLK